MGQGTANFERMMNRRLTRAERAERQLVKDLSGSDLEITRDRRLVKRARLGEAPREVTRVPPATWD
jgi:hypothetical protein